MMRYGIPEYRLPKDVLDDEISYIEELGVDIKTNASVKNVEDFSIRDTKPSMLLRVHGQARRSVSLAKSQGA
jgi:glutamate synthase (NADPH/NADH) small chain